MIFDQATDVQMQAARIFSGAAMVGFFAAPVFPRRARQIQMVVAGVYIFGVLGFTLYLMV